MYIAHISDLHIEDQYSIDRAEALVDKINSLVIRPDYVLVTGDIVEKRSKANLLKCFGILNKIRVPYYILSGNHDGWENFNEEIDEYCFFHPKSEISSGIQYIKDFSNHSLLVIDNSDCAFLSKDEDSEKLEWIEDALKKSQKPVLVAMHKFPDIINVGFFDKDVKNRENKIAKLLGKYKEKIKIVMCGHVHNSISSEISGIPVIATFSNVFSYKLKFESLSDVVRENPYSSFHMHYFDGDKFISYIVPF